MQRLEPHRRTAAETALNYLAATDPLSGEPADAIIGFGVFDLRLPEFCGELFAAGAARHLIFTGGIGGGTGGLGGPEAVVWRQTLRKSHPHIADADVTVEDRSTNTAENIGFAADLLARIRPQLRFGAGLRTAIIVASPSRLRRVRLTLQQLQPAVTVIRRLPAFSLDGECALYQNNGVDYRAHLAGELDRLIAYPARGWIAPEPLPPEIAAAHAVLRSGA